MPKYSRDELEVMFDYEVGKFGRCRFCRGAGCPGCDAEAQRVYGELQDEYEKRFPDGPECVTIPRERIGDAKDAIGADALQRAFGPNGGGVSEVFDKLEELGFGRPKPIGKTE